MQDRDQYPKLLIKLAHSIYYCSGPSGINHICADSFHHSLQVGMFCIIVFISATGFGYLEVDLGVIVGSYWIHICSSLVKVSCICSLAIE